jgi:DNA-binding IscR family transcriptional regulator
MCVLGFSECSPEKPCSVHEYWSSLRENIYQMLIRKNIADMGRDMRKPEYQRLPAVRAILSGPPATNNT